MPRTWALAACVPQPRPRPCAQCFVTPALLQAGLDTERALTGEAPGVRTHILTPRLTESCLHSLLPESLRYGFWDAVGTKHYGTLSPEGGHPGGLRVDLRLLEKPLEIENKSNATSHTGEHVDRARALA